MLKQWCTNVLRSKVAPMKKVARMIRRHFDGIVAWTQTRQTNGFIEALNGLFQAAKRKARGYTSFATMRTVLFLICRKARLHPHQPSRRLTHTNFNRAVVVERPVRIMCKVVINIRDPAACREVVCRTPYRHPLLCSARTISASVTNLCARARG